MEIVGPSYRYVIGLLGPVMWTTGAITSTAVGYFIRERITLQFLLSIPLLFFLGYILYEFDTLIKYIGSVGKVMLSQCPFFLLSTVDC